MKLGVILGTFQLQKGEGREVAGKFLPAQCSTPGPDTVMFVAGCLALLLLLASSSEVDLALTLFSVKWRGGLPSRWGWLAFLSEVMNRQW